jgi:hypothetical protein
LDNPELMGQAHFRLEGGETMSALRIGTNTASTGDGLGSFLDSLAKWIPGDVIAFYAAAIFALRATLEPLMGEAEVLPSQPTPYSLELLIGSAALAGILTMVGALSGGPGNPQKPLPAKKKDWLRVLILMALSVVAFLVWSLTIPQSWWTEQGVLVALATVAVAGFAIGFVPMAQLISNSLRNSMG